MLALARRLCRRRLAVVYNVMRIDGSSPADAAAPSLVIGAVAGARVFGAGLLLRAAPRSVGTRAAPRSRSRSPRRPRWTTASDGCIGLAWPALGALAARGARRRRLPGVDWLTASADDRGLKTTLILAAWNMLVGLWLGDEALRLRRDEADGIESLPLGCGLTAVLAAVGFSRDLASGGQLTLIVLAGVAGGLAGLAMWRLQGSRGMPVSAVGTVLVAVLSLVLPLIF